MTADARHNWNLDHKNLICIEAESGKIMKYLPHEILGYTVPI